MTTQNQKALLKDLIFGEEVNATKDEQIALEVRRLGEENNFMRVQHADLKAELDMWISKTDWVQMCANSNELGKHRADVMRERIEALYAENSVLQAGYDAARLEIDSLKRVRVTHTLVKQKRDPVKHRNRLT